MGHPCCSGRRKILSLDRNSSQSKAGMYGSCPPPRSCTLITCCPKNCGPSRSWITPHSNRQSIHRTEETNLIRTETQTPTDAIIQAPRKQTPVQATVQYDTHDGLNSRCDDLVQPHDHVIIVDSMALAQCIKSTGMKMIINFKSAFVKKITRMVKPYDEGCVIFDCSGIASR